MSDFADTVSSGAFGVDNALRDSLSCEMSEFIKQVEVLKEDGAIGTGSQRVLVVVDGGSLGVGDYGALHNKID
jgi:hypothetical protein